ncbi:hypothetical protein [Planctomicrobium piriforme]|uniref:DUF2238 domain-containing protein n=1 Tax=Planctomicrobium piriforme TaxID=1576369 RepID=A0A1I3KD79_9PLAN|nr:hypothetical protein [Planctomicrobium piriforme]SFI70469.1 hypothetical protein SAMN05421753_111196 [Planctomicrobium piriforme]
MSSKIPSWLSFTRLETAVILVTAAYVAPALFFSWNGGNNEFIMYAAVLVAMGACVLVLHRQARLHPAALWGLSLWGFAHMCGGLVAIPESWPVNPGEPHVLYNWWIIPGWLKYDQLVHASGFGLTTWICWQALRRAFENRGVAVTPSFGLLILCVAGGMGFGALNEVVEFLATRLMPNTNVGGYENTGWDLVFNLLGSVIAAVLIGVCGKKEKPATDEHR